MKFRQVLSLGCSLFSCIALASSTDEIPNIVVTAEFRPIALQDVSGSTSVVTEDMIKARSAEHLQEILATMPNVNWAGGTSRARYFQIRGVGDRSQFKAPLNPSVGVVIDGIDFSGLGSAGTLFDVNQVEVLRGPQGTLHGANAMAGIVNIRSNAPARESSHSIHASIADYGTQSLGLVSTGPLNSDISYRLAAQVHESDGYIENIYLHRDDVNNHDEQTARFRFRWALDESAQLDIIATYVDLDNGYDTFSLDNDRKTRSDQPGHDRQQSTALGLRYARELSSTRLEAALSKARTDASYGYDEDWTYPDFHPWGWSSTDNYDRDRDSYSAEVRWLSDSDARIFDDSTDWVTGFYLLDNSEELNRVVTYIPGEFASRYDTRSTAVFAHLDTALSDQLSLSYGLRVEQRQTDYRDNNNVAYDDDRTLWGGQITLSHGSEKWGLFYGTLARGYRANGVNADILASANLEQNTEAASILGSAVDFDAERLNNLELGWKAGSDDGDLQSRIALFYMDRRDQQVKGSLVVPVEGGGSSFIDFTDNAAEGSNYGAEVELEWRVSASLSLYSNIGFLRTEFDKFVNEFGEDRSGHDQAQAPDYQFAVGLNYRSQSGVFVNASIEGKDDFLFSDRHDAGAEAVELVNAKIGYRGNGWEASLWGNNLTDEDYYVRGFGSFGNDPRNDYVTEPYYQLGEPRVVGLSLSLDL